MRADRHRAIVLAAERFAEAARQAERAGQYGRAATLFRAALLVLEGRSVEDVEASLEGLTADRLPPFA